MYYAITTHLSIERESLIGMEASAVVNLAAEAGDLLTEAHAQAIIECAKADKAREEQEAAEAAEKASRKHRKASSK